MSIGINSSTIVDCKTFFTVSLSCRLHSGTNHFNFYTNIQFPPLFLKNLVFMALSVNKFRIFFKLTFGFSVDARVKLVTLTMAARILHTLVTCSVPQSAQTTPRRHSALLGVFVFFLIIFICTGEVDALLYLSSIYFIQITDLNKRFAEDFE